MLNGLVYFYSVGPRDVKQSRIHRHLTIILQTISNKSFIMNLCQESLSLWAKPAHPGTSASDAPFSEAGGMQYMLQVNENYELVFRFRLWLKFIMPAAHLLYFGFMNRKRISERIILCPLRPRNSPFSSASVLGQAGQARHVILQNAFIISCLFVNDVWRAMQAFE